jgi:hypothetical protein
VNPSRPYQGLFRDSPPVDAAVRNNGGGHVKHQFFWDIPRTSRGRDAEGRDRRRHQEGLRLGMGVPRREPLAAPPRDRVAAKTACWCTGRHGSSVAMSGARLLPEVQEPPPGLPQRLVEGRRLGCGRRTAPRRHGGDVPAVVRRGNSGAIRPPTRCSNLRLGPQPRAGPPTIGRLMNRFLPELSRSRCLLLRGQDHLQRERDLL